MIDRYFKGHYEEMLELAERSAVNGSGVSVALVAIASAELGKADQAREALAKMEAYGPLARDPAAYFRRHGAADRIADKLVSGLEKARRVGS